MRIAYYTWETRSIGGIQRITIDKVNYLAKLGHKVYIITRDQRGQEPFYSIDPRVEQIDISIDYQPVYQIPNPLKRHIAHHKLLNKHLTKLRQVLDLIKADICVNTVFCEEARLFPLIKDGSVKILESHGIKYALLPVHKRSGWRKYFGGVIDRLNRHWYDRLPSKYDLFIVLSPSHLEQWPNEKNIKAIYNMCTLRPDPSYVGCRKKNQVIALGRLSPEKNFSSLIRIWSRVFRLVPDWELLIVGEGTERPKLEKQIKELGLEKHVNLIGEVRDVAPMLNESQVCVLTSEHEGFPLALVEAQMLGIPTISYDCPMGPRDIILHEITGVLVPPREEDQFSQALIRIIGSPKVRQMMSQESFIASNRFSPDSVMQIWQNVFEEILKERK